MEKDKLIFEKEFNKLYEYNTTFGYSWDYGFLIDTLPENLIDECEFIYQDCLNNREKYIRNNDKLAGEILEEFAIHNFSDNLQKYLFELCRYFEVKSRGYIKKTAFLNQYVTLKSENLNKFKLHDLPYLQTDEIWMNMQAKHEYNPLHCHSGVISFVIWHKIPYDQKSEYEVGPARYRKDGDTTAGKFNFFFPSNGSISGLTIADGNRYENNIVLFPSTLHHCVNAFYSSDEYRVSFSGNLFVDDKKLGLVY